MAGLWFPVRRVLAALVAAATASVAVVVCASPGGASGQTVGDGVVGEVADIASATAAGERVEVLSERTAYSQLFAQPDGNLTVQLYSRPRHVQVGDGSWIAADATLQARPDGTVGPVASVPDLVFSGGGGGPFARIAVGERALSLSWPERLPEASISGSRATYAEVLPGVDLVLTADVDGFSELLVVKSRDAAANPALDEIGFGVATSGVGLEARDGGFVAVDDSGDAVFTSPAPMMWDSSSPVVADAANASPNAVSGPVDADARLRAPVDGDRVERMGLGVGSDRLVVRPDRAMLDDPDTVFPVYLDPTVSASRYEWASIQEAWPYDEYHNFDGDEGVGYCSVSNDSRCVLSGKKRLVWEFGIPAAVHGAQVFNATFSAWETHAYDCEAKVVELWQTAAISSATNWNNHAGQWQRELHQVNIARKQGCSNGPYWVEFDATAGAVSAAAGGSTLTLGLKAENESSMPGGWKKFRNDAVLSITYNSYPTTPDDLTVAGKPCGTGSSRPYVADATPDLRSVVHDPDVETDLKGEFVFQKWDTSLATPAWVPVGSAEQANKSSGDPVQVTVGVTSGTGPVLAHGARYRWQVRTVDPWSWRDLSGTVASPWSPWCELQVDTRPPASPGVTSADYPADGEFHGSPGVTGSFTFDPGGSTDVKGYKYGWADPPTTFVAAPTLGGSVTVPLTPPPPNPQDPTDSGPVTLYVVGVDRADQESAQTRYTFLVGEGAGPVARWELADAPGASVLVDSTGNGHDATPTAVSTGVAGRLLSGPAQAAPTAATFNGTSSIAATAAPVVDTSRSFTVAAWARVTSWTGWPTIVSADGPRHFGFALGNGQGVGWHFTLNQMPADGTPYTRALGGAARVGAWTHLVGVYDDGAKQMRLYVDGKLADTQPFDMTWSAPGPVLIGNARWLGTLASGFAGDLAEVTLWDRVLVGEEIAPMAATLVGRWALDGDGSDWSVFGRDAATVGGLTWTADRHGTAASAAQFDGATAYLQTAGPVVRTDQSFTVSAWVKVADGSRAWASAVSQNGSRVSGFNLQFAGGADPAARRWRLAVNRADADGVGADAAYSTSAAVVNQWAHLTGVFDGNAGVLHLYVNGVRQATVPRSTAPWNAVGALRIGLAQYNGGPSDWWPGAVDEVQVYAGAMPAAEVNRLYETSP